MASTKRAQAVLKKKVKNFTNLQEIVNWLNTGNEVVSLSASSGVVIGAKVKLNPGFKAYINGNYAYVQVIQPNGTVGTYNWLPGYIGYEVATTVEDLTNELNDAKANVESIQNKITFMKETGAEEFDEDEFKVYSTLLILDEKKASKFDKAKAIAALIKS